MKTLKTIHPLKTSRLLALALFFTVLAACTGAPASSPVPPVSETATAGISQATETAEATVTAPSPTETQAASPGSGLTEPRLVVQLPDNSIVSVSVDGKQSPVAAEAPKGLFAAGFGRHAMQDGPIVYARSGWVQPAIYAIDTLSRKVSPLDFIQQDSHGLAVRTLPEGSEPANPSASLAWGSFQGQGTPSTSLHLATSDWTEIPLGKDVTDVTYQPGQEFAFVPLRWGPDGSLYYSRMPIGIGGFIPYLGFVDLWQYDPASGKSTKVAPDTSGGQLCIDELSSDIRLLALTCEPGKIQVLDLTSRQTTSISLPEGIPDALSGNVRFSPGGDRLVYGIFLGEPDNQSGAVAISDGLSGASKVIAKSDAPGFYAPLAWLDKDTILVHFFPQDENAPSSLWMLKADGSQFTRIVDGSFLGLVE